LFEFTEKDPIRPAGQQPRQVSLAHGQWQIPQVITVHCQHIEGAELHFVVVPAGMQCVEIGIAVNAQDYCLAIDDEMLLAVF